MSISIAQKEAIKDLLDRSKTEGLLSTAKQLVEYLLANDLAYKQRLSPMDIGVHPQNRDNVGLHDCISSARLSLRKFIVQEYVGIIYSIDLHCSSIIGTIYMWDSCLVKIGCWTGSGCCIVWHMHTDALSIEAWHHTRARTCQFNQRPRLHWHWSQRLGCWTLWTWRRRHSIIQQSSHWVQRWEAWPMWLHQICIFRGVSWQFCCESSS